MTLRDWHGKSDSAAKISRAPVLLAFLLAAAGVVAAAERHAALPAPLDLGADGRQAAMRGAPVVILFSLPECPFCDVVRQNYLESLLRDTPEQQRPIIREVKITGTTLLSGFNREPISHRELARHYGARFAPTVVLVDRAGNLLAPPIVGGDVAGLYGGYLDNALAEASRKLAEARPIEMKGKTQ